MKQEKKKATKKVGKKDTTKAISGNLEQALETFNQRGAAYGPSYLQYGEVISSLFPEGINLQSTDDINRFGLMSMIISKREQLLCISWILFSTTHFWLDKFFFSIYYDFTTLKRPSSLKPNKSYDFSLKNGVNNNLKTLSKNL